METVLEFVAVVVGLAAVALLIYIAWYDFNNLTIRNTSVLLLLGLYLIWVALTGFQTFVGDLGVGVLLFILGLVMWLVRLMGAGDVKLYFGLGLFMGINTASLFAILLLITTIAFLLVMVIASKSGAKSGIPGRLREIRTSGKAPYAVPMCLAAIPCTLIRVLSGT